MHHLPAVGVLSALFISIAMSTPAAAQEHQPPERIEVLPVFFIPDGAAPPTATQRETLMAHVEWSRERFHEMLDCRGTFDISPDAPRLYNAEHRIAVYQHSIENGVPMMTSELLEHFGYSRFETPHIYLMLVMNPAEDFPPGGGRPCNGGFNTGGGVIVMSSYALDNHPNFQSTLQHELGHSFGLPHVDVYGYSMTTNRSIMSYNPAHHTHFFEPSETPGILIPEDVRGLAWNDRAFPRLAFEEPAGYELASPVWLGPMTIPGQPDNHVAASTPSGEADGSSVQNVVQGRIKPSAGPGITFDPQSMWSSDFSETGWVRVDLTFPFPIELNRVAVHSEHSGLYHRAEHVIVRALIDGSVVDVADADLAEADAIIDFDSTTAQKWNFVFQAGDSQIVVIRGLQFYRDHVELFPPFIPEPVATACLWDLSSDGAVGVADLLTLLTTWGPSPAGPADFDCDGDTGVADLLAILLHWGACD